MNIFYLSKHPSIAAAYHCDKHVIKMILESAQMLSTAHRVLEQQQSYIDLYDLYGVYKKSHENHPSSIWVRQSEENYKWLFDLMCNLLSEYRDRYQKIHACERLTCVLKTVPRALVGIGTFTNPPQCMPDQYKQKNTVLAYREYYNKEKKFAKWEKKDNTPLWFNENREIA